MRRTSISIFVAGITLASVMGLSPSVSASMKAQAPGYTAADASDRAKLLTGLQRSWAKLNSTSRYKACWMWNNRPDMIQSGLVSSFAGYGFSNADIYAVARTHFSRVC